MPKDPVQMMPKDPVQIGNADLSPIQHLWDHFLEQLDPPLRDGLNRIPFKKGDAS